MKRVLVTGSNGQLGKCIQQVAKNYPDLEFDFRTSKDLDIIKANDINAILVADDFDYCINCAAYTNVEQAEKTPKRAFEVNAEGVRNLALSCLVHKVILIHISTDYVFDGEKEEPYTVDDMPNPINEYGKSKLQGEQYIKEVLTQYYIIRTSWLYSEFGNNFYKTILEKAKTQKVLHVTNQQLGSPTNANNLAKYILELIISSNKNYGIQHFTDGEAMTWYDFAVKIILENNLNPTTEVVIDNNYRSFVRRPKFSILEKLKRD